MAKFESVRGQFRAIWLAPLFAVIALGAWAFASPIGAAPDDDYHLVSIWCANGGGEHCADGENAANRTITASLEKLHCYAYDEERSAGCQEAVLEAGSSQTTVTTRGNFAGEYPPLFYASMGLLSGENIIASAMSMRWVNVLIFVGLAVALYLLLPVFRRGNLVWGWLVTLVPLGIFLVTSNNPSSWAIMGVGSAWLSLLGYFESTGTRKFALGGIFVFSVLLASGARADAAFFTGGAIVTVLVLKFLPERRFMLSAILPAVGLVVALLFFLSATQAGIGSEGFTTAPSDERPDAEVALGSLGLVAFNILNLPYLWTGVFGAWGLGWLDTHLPTIVLWGSAASFIGVGFAGLAVMSWRKVVAFVGTGLVLVFLPLYVLYQSNAAVGTYLQSRYLLPLVVIFALVLVFVPQGREFRLGAVQRWAVIFGLSVANFVALQVNIRRYVTGVDAPGISLDAGAEWWWSGVPFSPNAVWLLGSVAFAALVVVLVREVSHSSPDRITASPMPHQ